MYITKLTQAAMRCPEMNWPKTARVQIIKMLVGKKRIQWCSVGCTVNSGFR